MPDTGSAPNKTFSRSDGTRTGSEVWQEAKAAPVKIRADDHDAHDQDIADALNARLMNNGGNQPSADIPWNDKRITGLGAPTARTDAMRLDKVQDGAVIYGGTAGGTGDAVTVTLSPAITAYATGMLISFKASATNTGAATLNANSVGAKSLKKGPDGASALVAGDITSGGIYICHYDGTNLQLLNPKTPAGRVIGTDIQAQDAFLQNIADLSDPNADRGLFWDDSGGALGFFSASSPLTFSGTALTVSTASDSATGVIEIAVQSEMEAASSTTLAVTPGRQHFHPTHSKAGGLFDGSGTPAFLRDHGMGAITDTSDGIYGLAFDTAFSDTNFWGLATGSADNSAQTRFLEELNSSRSTSGITYMAALGSNGNKADADLVSVAFWGDYA